MTPKRHLEEAALDDESLKRGRYSGTTSSSGSTTSPDDLVSIAASPSPSMTETSDLEMPPGDDVAAGYISQVTMINFMCHAHLTVDLCPGMNFIIGRNGSGKSTVLTAISTCLGGKASNTQRASSLKSFVKEGQPKAIVQVTLHNEGRGAFEPEKYGPSITVERSIVRESGSSAYKIKSAIGKTVSDKRKDLERILESFRIQIDNPFAILTQDTARTFLTASTEKAKYDYFRRGLLFDKIDSYRDGTYDKLRLTEANLEQKKMEVKERAAEMEKWKHQYKLMEVSSSAEKEISDLSGLLYWNRVSELEAKVADQQETISDIDKQIEELTQRHGVFVEKFADAERRVQQHEEQGAILSTEHRSILDELREVEQIATEIESELKTHQANRHDLVQNQKSTESSIKSIEAKIQELKDKEEELYGHKQVELEARKMVLKDKIRDIDSELMNLRDEEEQMAEELNRIPRKLTPLTSRARELDNSINEESTTLNNLKNSERGKLDAFGKHMSRILNDISSSNDFKGHKPIGPVGTLIALKEPIWGSVLETALTRVLDGFIVENHDDRATLKSILDKYSAKNPIFVRQLDRFDYKSSMPDRKFMTVLDGLDIKDENVKYLLIDYSSVEKIILIEGRSRADDIMYNRPRNVARCLAIDPCRPTDGFIVGSKVAGASSIQPINGWRGMPRMTTDTSFQVESLRASIARNKNERREVEARMVAVRGEKNKIDKAIVDNRRKASRLRAEAQSFKDEIERIESEIDLEMDSTKIQKLYATLDEQKEQLKQYEDQLVDLYAAKVEIDTRRDEMKEKKRAVEVKLRDIRERLTRDADEREAIEKEKKKYALQRDRASEKLIELKDHHKAKEVERLNTLKEKIERYSEEARQYSEERLALQPGQTVLSVNEKIKELEQIVAEHEKNCGLSFEDVVENAQRSSALLADAQKNYDELRQLFQSLTSSQESRYLMLRNVFERTKTEIKRNFKFNLQERGFNGTLDISDKEGVLSMKVAPSSAENSQKQDVSVLSGGEKSFTQIALLVSIWQTMKSRALALDEFDVFMDKVNREISLKLVSEALTRLNQTQSIFITPQDMDQTAIDLEDRNVKIFRMQSPVR